tara:strand:- start:243 stop:434 length:192 start_codon:yes stop_codon:yes gene_type:complete
MNKFLTSKEYNEITKIIFNSIDYKYGSEIFRKSIDKSLDKLFTITENHLISNEAINHPITTNS